jgi:excisionase family DNA binding protein
MPLRQATQARASDERGAPERAVPAALSGLSGQRGVGRLLAAEDVAAILGVRSTFVYALARRGELPAVRIGERYVRFRAEALERWILDQESTRPYGTR